jgi:hypothetical protein
MASEDIGSVFTTQIPGLTDNADIQTALRLYHYGQSTAPSTKAAAIRNSIAGHLDEIEKRATALEVQGIGSLPVSGAPNTQSDAYGKVNGYILMDKTSVAPILVPDVVARYQTSAPTGSIATGTLWVDSDSSPLKMYVYSGTAWREMGAA